MNILAADDERAALNILVRAIEAAEPGAVIRAFSRSDDILLEAEENGYTPDVAFLDIDMPGISGLELAKRLRELCPAVNIVFVTGYSQYALEAMALRPSGYVLKPASREKIRTELDNLRIPVPSARPPRAVRIQCFGNFEVFAGGEPLRFTRSKAKELLAYLIDRRGARCSAEELMAALWEEREDTGSLRSNYRNAAADLSRSLRGAGAEDILYREPHTLAVIPERVDCDYYDYLHGDSAAINGYTGEYMSQYSWAEMTVAALERFSP